jgi:GxxExxY protein
MAVLEHRALTATIISLAIKVHRYVGPGLLESVYKECLGIELAEAGITFERETTVPVVYRARTIPLGFRADIIVDNKILIEIKAVVQLIPARQSQRLTCLRMSGLQIGPLMNFHAPRLKDGVRRLIV